MEHTQNYELYFILQPNLTADQVDAQIANVTKIIEGDIKATNIAVDNQGVQKLAYKIKKYLTGTYVLMTFDVHGTAMSNISAVEKKLNIIDDMIRYIIVNQTDFLIQQSKQEVRTEVEFASHRDLNKGLKKKKSYPSYMKLRVVDYKNVEFLNQFTSPYSKIFVRSKTGTHAKFQRKLNKAIKRARHMALMSFTPQYK